LNTKLIEKYLISFLILLIISYGFYLCFIGGYGSDEDTLPMIYVFEAKLHDGRFVSSRFTGYPVPEIGIGFLSYFFGSFAANSATFLFHLIGLLLIFISFEEKIDFKKLNFFLLLCLSSPVLFFENLEPMDYSWAFLFFSIGTFFYSRKIFELAILAFGFAIGSRLNFLIFSMMIIFFFNFHENINIKRKITIFFCAFIVGGLFYLPIWFFNSFNLDWISAARPTEQGLLGLFTRFSFKTWSAIGYLQFFLILFGFRYLNKKDFNDKTTLLIILIISNLLLFLYIPAELSYLQPAIIFLYLITVNKFKKSILISLIIINFINWGVNFQFLNIIHKDNSICGPKHAINATFDFKITDGAIHKFIDTRKMIKCWINDKTIRGKRILEGKSIKIYK
tara:strand:- start:14088 stop:15266 length:1179 start_codon:yes stop_codon:yes gene_type:complete